jgi:apolipoprotein N-acyltransferase
VILRAGLASALLLAASAPPSPLPLLVLGALVPVAVAVPRSTPLEATRGGALFFAVHWAVVLAWIPQAGLRVGAWTWVAWLAMVLTLTLLGALFGRLLHHLAVAARLPLWLALCLAWMTVEVGRGSLLGPLDFPWLGIAVPLVAHPPLLQGAAWLGESGLATGVVLVNGVVAAAVVTGGRSSPARPDVLEAAPTPPGGGAGGARLRPLLALGVAVAAVYIAGSARIAGVALRPVASFVAVQPAVPLEVKRGPDPLAPSVAAVERLLPRVLAVVRGVDADAVVLPETALPAPTTAVAPILASWSRRLGRPVVAGAEGRIAGRRSNAVVAALPGRPVADWPLAHKVRLVPGVEWSPLPGDGWARGSGAGTLPLQGVTLAPLVCIESAGAEPARGQVARGADVLVNVTNDAWLAEAPGWSRSPAFHQHPAHLALRSVETGRGALRVGNNGLTEVVDPLGRRRRLLPPHRPGVALARVHSLEGETAFVAGGWWLPRALLAATLVAGLRPWWSRRRASAPVGSGADGRGSR